MALFGRKKQEQEDVKSAPQEEQVVARTPQPRRAPKTSTVSGDLAHVLLRPHITEKATDSAARGVYVFDIAEGTNKKQVATIVEKLYSVRPVKVRIARIPRKTIRNPRTGTYGVTTGGRKAYVYLKQGDSIAIM